MKMSTTITSKTALSSVLRPESPPSARTTSKPPPCSQALIDEQTSGSSSTTSIRGKVSLPVSGSQTTLAAEHPHLGGSLQAFRFDCVFVPNVLLPWFPFRDGTNEQENGTR